MRKANHNLEQEVERLCAAIATLSDEAEARAFLVDILSPRELDDLAQRLEVARLLADGSSYVDDSSATGASSTTVSRVSKCLNGEAGGYRTVLARLDASGDAS